MIKRLFDIVFSLIGLIVLIPCFFLIGLWIKLDSKGSVLFKQVRVGRYNKDFKEQALKLSDDIGLKKASEQFGLKYSTVAGWRQTRNKKNNQNKDQVDTVP